MSGRQIPHVPQHLPALGVRDEPPPHMFISLDEQLENVRRWNEERVWGLEAEDLDSIDLTPRTHSDPLVVDLIAVYLGGLYREELGLLDGVRHTCHEMWHVASKRQLYTWSWDWLRDHYRSEPKPVRLLPGIVHKPGARRVTLDLGAHWSPGRHLRPRNLRGRASAHAELLAAAAHFPRWVRSMNGRSVPYVWLGGYQVTFPRYATNDRLLGLAWVTYRHTLSLTVARADHALSGWAAPVLL